MQNSVHLLFCKKFYYYLVIKELRLQRNETDFLTHLPPFVLSLCSFWFLSYSVLSQLVLGATQIKISSMNKDCVFLLWKPWYEYLSRHQRNHFPVKASFNKSSCRCYCSVAKSYLAHCDLKDCNKPSFSVLHYLTEFAQIYVHWVSEAS